MKKLIIFILLLLLSIINCSKKEEIKNINLSKPAKTKAIKIPKDALLIGIAAVVSPKESFLYYEELLNYISKKLKKPIITKYGKYKEIHNLLKSNQLHIAFICSGEYVNCKSEFGLELLAVPQVNNKTEYYSYIIVHKDSKIKHFSELAGKSFAFVDPLSNTGYLFPVYYLAKENKIYQKFFSKTIFTYSHDNSIIAVAEKLVDAAAVDSLIYDYLKETNPELIARTKIILISPPFGIPPVVVNKNIDKNLKEKIRNIFLQLHNEKEGRDILLKLKIEKFIKGSDKMYEGIRMMKEKVNEIE